MLYVASLIIASAVSTIPIAFLVVDDGDGQTYTSVIADQIREGGVHTRNLSIVCSKGCSGNKGLSERFDDNPLGIFRLGDMNNLIYVTSTSGSSYRIRAYLLEEDSISKVLEVSSLDVPVITTEHRKETLIITERISENSRKVVTRKLIWSGSVFKRLR